MKTALELLALAPREQITRIKIICRCIAKGEWTEAEHHLQNICDEEGDSPFGLDAGELLMQCRLNKGG